MKKEAYFYKKENSNVVCCLCPRNCVIKEGQRGACNVRINESGTLYTLNYGEISSVAIDPIEKKPLFHFKPGSSILSLGSIGCNFHCGFCQNFSISKEFRNTEYFSFEDLTRLIEKEMRHGSIGAAFTYNEPSVWYEYILDTIKNLDDKIKIVLVTNGYISEEPLKKILPYIDAVNIDLKAFSNSFYKNICGGNIENVKESIETASSMCHTEITNLLVNGYNDSDDEIEKLSMWLSKVSPDIPLHITRYYPAYKFKASATPCERLLNARKIAEKYLNYVYLGNMPINVDNNTYCPQCRQPLILRENGNINVLIHESICPNCGHKLPIVI